MLRLIVASMVLCCTIGIAEAQYPTPFLKDLKTVHLEIFLRDDGCGVYKQLIQDAFMYPASAAKFEVVNDQNSAQVLISVINIKGTDSRINRMCVTQIDMMVHSPPQPIVLSFSNVAVKTPIMLWTRSFIVGWDIDVNPSHTKEKIEEMTKAFVTDWNLSNK